MFGLEAPVSAAGSRWSWKACEPRRLELSANHPPQTDAHLLEVLQPDEAITYVVSVQPTQATQCAAQQIPERELIGGNDAAVPFPPRAVVLVEYRIVADVMGQDGTVLSRGVRKLLGVALATTIQLQHMNGVVSALPQNLGEQHTDVFIEQQADRRHHPFADDRCLSSVCSASSVSMTPRLS